ncbi:MAG: ankyrin repeat domain-containing protein [Verrucomicrobia bacterium]|nr:ankyrin repeat domain-containing protein [Verrucomicrobiota bacterium]
MERGMRLPYSISLHIFGLALVTLAFLCLSLGADVGNTPSDLPPPDPELSEVIKKFNDASGVINREALLESLLRAVAAGMEQEVERLVAHGAPLNRGVRGFTALHMAALYGRTDIGELLIGLGADIENADTQLGFTPLHIAAAGRPDFVRLLLSYGADVDAHGHDQRTPLMIAAEEGQPEVVEVLLKHGANPVTDTQFGTYVLHFAAEGGSTGVVAAILDRTEGSGIDEDDASGYTPLMRAIIEGHSDVAALLLDRGADFRIANEKGRTALDYTAWYPAPVIAARLLEEGALLNKTDKRGWTPFLAAAETGDLRMLNLFAEYGADMHARTSDERTALHLAAMQGQVDAIRWLIGRGFSVSAIDDDGDMPLTSAADHGHEDAIGVILEAGADPNATDQTGWSALLTAISKRRCNVIEVLASGGADVNSTLPSGTSPLMLAARRGLVSCIDQLIKYGADADHLNENGHGAFSYAIWGNSLPALKRLLEARADSGPSRALNVALFSAIFSDRTDMVETVLGAGADPNYGGTNGWTSLMTAADRGRDGTRVEIIKLLLEHGADPNMTGAESRWTAMISAVRGRCPECVEVLLDAEADPELSDSMGFTPLMHARTWGAPECARVLIENGANVNARSKDGVSALLTIQLGMGEEWRDVERLAVSNGAERSPEDEDWIEIDIWYDDSSDSATNVSFVGYFNHWSVGVDPLQKNEEGLWHRRHRFDFYTNHIYKFVVDGEWHVDPVNKHTKVENGVLNSLLIMTKDLKSNWDDAVRPYQAHFELRGYSLAENVSVAGEFNGWNTGDHPLQRSPDGVWRRDLTVVSGEYGYKFVVDGEWLLDPANPLTKVVGGVTNSLLRAE